MIPESIYRLIVHARGSADSKALHDPTAVFWIDWREEPAEIPGICEGMIGTHLLSAEEDDESVYVVWRGTRTKIPLTQTGADPHVTLFTINNAIRPEYEIRFVRQSVGNDSAAFVILSTADWQTLEEQYGRNKVADAFAIILERPNLFTERASGPPSIWKFW